MENITNNNKLEKICILGLGYIGLPTAAMFATHGKTVYGVEINRNIVDVLQNGGIHIEEPGLQELVKDAIQSGKLIIGSDVKPADAFIIAVPTPFKHSEFGYTDGKKYKLADMDAVKTATEAIVPHLREGNLVVLESTSPPQTTINLITPILERSGLVAGKDFYVTYSPERVLPGQILKELVENARVIGGITPDSAEKGKELYSCFVKGKIITTNSTTAEMVKLMENTYRDVNIAIANEFSRFADIFGIDIFEAISIANLHPRVKILQPGIGVGGHCISVDPWFLVEKAPNTVELIYQARKTNDSQPQFIVEKIKKTLSGIKNPKIACLGVTYKPDVDDFRESPALEIINLLHQNNLEIKIFDPYIKRSLHKIGESLEENLEDALKDADLIVILVDHKIFRDINWEKITNKKCQLINDICKFIIPLKN
ncbi:nucleotide sugar dehydrogenase [Leptolinea tardivitalis]|uniref:UDP-N-acetyl-D-mannosamine dehydrogenase n=1 Tax=Leptolinea tardivitalis TaxID=229920 RepID=A0A0P6X806_9CHLR|nr:nucleotide sugar dehydrogenase [Leptolinea tardivitalis]KPL71302.1 UDP-N-acetyl-D-mannosamine dehydrogenase [Leptolinea tardivitalis]GAP23075.1 nucleotide sugar dehydrogenase [Leptolinea tardivitalis]